MPKYKVWNPDDEGPEDAEEIEAASPEEAAENYTTGFWNAGYSDSVDVMVMDEKGDEYDITVDVSFEPVFYAYGQKVRK